MACAIHLDKIGFRVFGGVRKEKDAEPLLLSSAGRITPLLMDVTSEASIATAVESVAAAIGDQGLAGLVNNAGIVVGGPLEFLPLSEIRKQFEVNVIGQIAVTQAFLPFLRTSNGRIVNMCGISGRVATPFLGPYSASKFAFEAIADVLRIELQPWGISVSTIEPGQVMTPIWKKSLIAAEKTAQNFPSHVIGLYGSSIKAFTAAVEKIAATGIDPDIVARAVAHALTARNPKTRYLVGHNARILIFLKKVLSDRLYDQFIIRYFGLSGKSIA
jgi:NAD(P)-dependent dehydrogenase (short-subunit alcohol dehydrogenase family)